MAWLDGDAAALAGFGSSHGDGFQKGVKQGAVMARRSRKLGDARLGAVARRRRRGMTMQ